MYNAQAILNYSCAELCVLYIIITHLECTKYQAMTQHWVFPAGLHADRVREIESRKFAIYL